MPVALGFKSYLQWGRESTYGTAAAATLRAELISSNIKAQIGVIRDPSLNAQISRRGVFQGGLTYKGQIVTRMNYFGLLSLLDGVYGTGVFAQRGSDVTSVSPTIHSFRETTSVAFTSGTTTSGSASVTALSPADGLRVAVGAAITGTGIPAGTTVISVQSSTALTMSANATATGAQTNIVALQQKLLLNSYTLELSEGDNPYGKVTKIKGATITGVTIRAKAGTGNDAMLQATWDIMATSVTTNATPTGGLTPPVVNPVLYHQGTVVDPGTTNITGTLSSGAATVTASDTSRMSVGMTLSGTGITAGTTVLSIQSGTAFTMSANATASGANAIAMGFINNPTGPVRLREFEVSIKSPIDEGRFYVGNLNIDQPVRNDFLQPTMKLVMEYNDYTLYDLANTFAVTSPEIVFNDGATNQLKFRMQEGVVTDEEHPINGYGIMMQTVTYEGFRTSNNFDKASLYTELANSDLASSY